MDVFFVSPGVFVAQNKLLDPGQSSRGFSSAATWDSPKWATVLFRSVYPYASSAETQIIRADAKSLARLLGLL